MEAFLVITLLTLAAVTLSGTTPELSTTTGATVNIPCLFGEGTLSNIFWSYSDGTRRHKILSLAEGELTVAAEYANRASLQDGYSTLILKEITVADEGTYQCVVDRLKQTAVSNINTKLNVFNLRPDTLPAISPCNGAGESSSCSIHANQSFTLTCTLPNVYHVEDTELTWYQDRKQFSSIHDVTQNDDGTTDISRQIKIYETGIFTCNATYLSANGREKTAVSVEAWIIPPADVPNTPAKNMTRGEIVGITIGIVLLVTIFQAIITLFLHRLKARGRLSSRKYKFTSDETQVYEEELKLFGTSAEKGSNDGNVKTSPTDKPAIDEILVALAEKIPDDHLDQLGKELGFTADEMVEYYRTNSRDLNGTYDEKLAMLQDWGNKRFVARELQALSRSLMNVGLLGLAVEILNEEVPDMTVPLISSPRNINSLSTATTATTATAAFTTSSPQEVDSSTLLSSSTEAQDGSFNRIVSEKEFIKLSRLIEPNFYEEMGIHLDIPIAELGQIKEHSQDTSDALMTVFTRWRDKQPPSTDIRALLAEELEITDLGSLSGELLAGSLVLKRTVEYPTLPQSCTVRNRYVNRTNSVRPSSSDILERFIISGLHDDKITPVRPSSSDILESFIISGLHPNDDKWVDWPHTKTVVCLIDNSHNSQDIVIKHNDPHPKHTEEILIEYINSKLEKTKIKCITMYLNYSSCTQCSGKLQILKKKIPDLQIKFSAFSYIRRPSCTVSCRCYTADPKAFKVFRKLDARPFQKDDWADLINLLRKNDEKKGHPTSDLNGLRYGDEYRVWRNKEDEKMMADYLHEIKSQ